MAIRVGINGFGRIGRNVFRVMNARRDEFEVVAVNDLTDNDTLAHLLRYDSVHGRFGGSVKVTEHDMIVDGQNIRALAERDPANLPWKELSVDFVVESTGVFRSRDACQKHIDAGAGKVLLTVPPKDEIDNMIVFGANEDTLRPEDRIISNASCTTNCLAPMAKVLHTNFGIQSGLMTTVHAYTNDQAILDLPHKDLRRARAAAQNIIPTSTGAARAVGKVLPALNGKLDGCAMRVPVPDGSVVDLVAVLDKAATKDDINAAMKAAADKELKGIMEYSEDPLVSTDIIGNPHSNVFDALSTMASGNMVKVIGWYDNEWGYSNRVVDLVTRAHALTPAGVA